MRTADVDFCAFKPEEFAEAVWFWTCLVSLNTFRDSGKDGYPALAGCRSYESYGNLDIEKGDDAMKGELLCFADAIASNTTSGCRLTGKHQI